MRRNKLRQLVVSIVPIRISELLIAFLSKSHQVNSYQSTNKQSHLMIDSQIRSLRASRQLKVSADQTASINKLREVSGKID